MFNYLTITVIFLPILISIISMFFKLNTNNLANQASLTRYYYYYASWVGTKFGFILAVTYKFLYQDLHDINPLMSKILVLAAISYGLNGFARSLLRLSCEVNILPKLDFLIKRFLQIMSMIALLITLIIIGSILFETIRFFNKIPAFEFLFGLNWNPEEEDIKSFGAVPVFVGSLVIMVIAMVIAIPLGLFSAIYLREYAKLATRKILKPLLEMLAGIPSIIYGYFAALTLAPLIKKYGELMHFDVAYESAISAGLVMGIMIVPYISSIIDDVLGAIPNSLRDGALALGSTKAETIIKVILPASMPGVISAILLAISRAIGETMIVTMAAGLQANLTLNPFAAVTTVTAQIVSLMTGDQEFNSAKTLAAFALALMLFIITFSINFLASIIVNHYKKRYE